MPKHGGTATAPPRRPFAVPLDLTGVSDDLWERFWGKVDCRAPDECWPWRAHCKPNGYGQFVLRKGVFMTASRIALALTIGRPLVVGEVACHDCDNPPCCNPAHLFPGTQVDNALDCVRKGRARRARGVDHASAKLTDEVVREIRAYPGRYGLIEELGRKYGVAGNTIRRIRDGRIWRHVA